MGNQLTKKFVRSKFTKIGHNNENFIINHSQHNAKNDITDIKTFDERRKLFISLLGLMKSWQHCPSNVLYSAIFVLPLKSKWIYSPDKHLTEILQSSVFSNIPTQKFIQLLQWKDSQKLLICMLDDYQSTEHLSVNEKCDQLIHPVWYYISDKFDKLKLNKLKLDTDWWKNEIVATSSNEPQICIHEILSEFYFKQMKFKTMKQIINQSNPNSLHVIEYYSSDVYVTERKYILCKLNNNNKTDDTYNNWWIASDYKQENNNTANMVSN